MAKVRLSLDQLFTRTMPSATLVNGVLSVAGTEGNDIIVVRQIGDKLSVQGQKIDVDGTPVNFVSAAGVTRVDVNALGGNDIIRLNTINMASSANGGGGNDNITGGHSDDSLFGGAGNDRLTGNAGSDDLSGDDGDDSVSGGSGDDLITGDAGDDSLSGNSGSDDIQGGSGDDSANGGAGDDSMDGEDGDDSINGSAGDDSVLGGSGNDSCSGSSGDDVIFGEDGDDSLSGGANDDLLLGDDGDDSVNGNSGNDDCQGGLGDDDVRNDDSGGAGVVSKVEGTITAIDLVASIVTIQTQAGNSIDVLVGPTTKIERNEVHTTLDTFLVGDPCEAKFDAQGATLKIEAGVDDNGGGGGGGEQDRLEGTITAIDLTNSTVTVKKQNGDSVVVTVVSSTKIERNDQHVTLAAFQVGDICEARFDSQGLTLKIEAVGA